MRARRGKRKGPVLAGALPPLGRGTVAHGRSRPWREFLKQHQRKLKGQWPEMGVLPGLCLASCPEIFVRLSIPNSCILKFVAWNHISLHFQSCSQCLSRSMASPEFSSPSPPLSRTACPQAVCETVPSDRDSDSDIQWQEGDGLKSRPWPDVH